jgi:hypothetical protein
MDEQRAVAPDVTILSSGAINFIKKRGVEKRDG